jgi:signal transduction histidine kinase
VNAREEERRRLRRDLHDGLGPTLASQTLKLDAAMELLQSHDTAARRILQDVKTQTQNTVADIRRIVYELRPPALDDLGLVGALRAHFAQHNDLRRLPITFQAAQELPPLSAAVQVNGYRIVLEAVNNVIHHAQAAHCEVTISTNRTLHLEIRDDGVGLPEGWHAGVGVTSMRERAVELGGSFLIENNAPKGTRVVAELPLGGQT